MSQRKILRDDLRFTWNSVIEHQYTNRRIDSEASLQVHFAAALLGRFESEGRTRRIFVEPTIKILSPKLHKIPDLLICNQRSIIGMVELKYKPRGRVDYRKDLETLLALSEQRLEFSVSNARYLGPKKVGKVFSLAPNAVLCWAAVYRGKRVADESFLRAEAREEFLALHALTSEEHEAFICTS